MTPRWPDGSAGDADYGVIGRGYSRYRRPEPRIAAPLWHALGDSASIVNVGAGAGSYEPTGTPVTAVEPSARMRAQRPAELPAAIDALAQNLPFDDNTFDAAMTTFSIHQWDDLGAGLREMRRVSSGPVAVLTCDPELIGDFWLADYAPELLAVERRRFPAIPAIADGLGTAVTVQNVPIPSDCADGFIEAYFGRPESFLDPGARAACSAWSFLTEDAIAGAIESLAADLRCGAWDASYGHLRSQPSYHGSLTLVVSG